jgi:hypothetical protein
MPCVQENRKVFFFILNVLSNVISAGDLLEFQCPAESPAAVCPAKKLNLLLVLLLNVLMRLYAAACVTETYLLLDLIASPFCKFTICIRKYYN